MGLLHEQAVKSMAGTPQEASENGPEPTETPVNGGGKPVVDNGAEVKEAADTEREEEEGIEGTEGAAESSEGVQIELVSPSEEGNDEEGDDEEGGPDDPDGADIERLAHEGVPSNMPRWVRATVNQLLRERKAAHDHYGPALQEIGAARAVLTETIVEHVDLDDNERAEVEAGRADLVHDAQLVNQLVEDISEECEDRLDAALGFARVSCVLRGEPLPPSLGKPGPVTLRLQQVLKEHAQRALSSMPGADSRAAGQRDCPLCTSEEAAERGVEPGIIFGMPCPVCKGNTVIEVSP